MYMCCQCAMASSSRPKVYKRKRSRNVLSIETKTEIIKRLGKGETVSSLARIFNVGKATVSDIKSNKDKIMSFASKLDSEDGSKKRKTMRNAKDVKLEEALYIWFVQRRSKGEPISGPMLCEKVLQFNNQLDGPPDFKASQGWLRNFKSRHGIQQLEIQGESLSSDAPAADNVKETLLAALEEGYSLDDVYNADETGLSWNSLPQKSLPSQREAAAPGFKKCKERVTILVAANASGSHRLPMLMIGKAKQPHCFKNVTCLPLCYKAQKSAWMNREIFLDWFTNQFIPDVKRLREQEKKTGKVILLLDNAPFHPGTDTLNAVDANFKVIFLPSNVTSQVQPMEQGVIGKLKMMYKKQVLRHLLLAEDEESVVAFSEKLNLKDCCYMLADAWASLSQDNLNKAWSRLFGEKGGNETTAVDTNDDCINELVELFQALPGFSDCEKDDARMWLEHDNDSGFQFLNDEEIVSFVQEENLKHVVTHDKDLSEAHAVDQLVDYEEKPKCRPSPEEAFIALETVMAWYEQEDDSCPKQLLMLKRMQDLAAKRRLQFDAQENSSVL